MDSLDTKVVEFSAAFKTLSTCLLWCIKQTQCFSCGLYIRVSFAGNYTYYNVCRGLLTKDIVEKNFWIDAGKPQKQNIIDWAIDANALFDKSDEFIFKVDDDIIRKITKYKEQHYAILPRDRRAKVLA